MRICFYESWVLHLERFTLDIMRKLPHLVWTLVSTGIYDIHNANSPAHLNATLQ